MPIGESTHVRAAFAVRMGCARRVIIRWELGNDAATTRYLTPAHTPDEAVRQALATVTEP